MKTCQVCGRTPEEINDQLGKEVEISEHQGIQKCSKCIKEYERETGNDKVLTPETPDELEQDKDWKDQVLA